MIIKQRVNRTAPWSDQRELDNRTRVVVHVIQHRVLDEDKGCQRVEHIEVEHDGFVLEDPMLDTWRHYKPYGAHVAGEDVQRLQDQLPKAYNLKLNQAFYAPLRNS